MDIDKRAFYDSPAWRHKRKIVLRRDGYRCQYDKRFGKDTEAKLIHHIFPLLLYPEYRLETWNLISLSVKAHEKLHDRESDLLSDEGWRLLQRTAAQRNIKLTELDKLKCLGHR